MPESLDTIIEKQILKEENEDIMVSTTEDEFLEVLFADDYMFNDGQVNDDLEDFEDDSIIDFVEDQE